MKKKMNMVFALICMFSLLFVTGCGGSEKSPYEGKWVAVSAQMMGMSIGVEEAFGGAFELEVKNGGKVDVVVGEDSGKGEWSVQDDEFTLTIEGEEMIGVIGEDTISFDDMAGHGRKAYFCKRRNGCHEPGIVSDGRRKSSLG